MPAGNDVPVKFGVILLITIFGPLFLIFYLAIGGRTPGWEMDAGIGVSFLVWMASGFYLITQTRFKFAGNIVDSNERIIKKGWRIYEQIVVDKVPHSPMCIDAAAVVQVFHMVIEQEDPVERTRALKEITKFISMNQPENTDEQLVKFAGKLKDIQVGKKIEEMDVAERDQLSKDFSELFTFKDKKNTPFHADLVAFCNSAAVNADGDPISSGFRIFLSKYGMHDGMDLQTEEVGMLEVGGMPTKTNFCSTGSFFITSVPLGIKQDPVRFSGIIGGPSYEYEDQSIEVDVIGYSTRTLRDGALDYADFASKKVDVPDPWYATWVANVTKGMQLDDLRQKLYSVSDRVVYLEDLVRAKTRNALQTEIVSVGGGSINWKMIGIIGIPIIVLAVVAYALFG